MTKEVPRTSVLRDEELIAYLRLQGLDKDIAAADRIEELGKACTEWAEVSQSNYQRAKAAEAKLAECEARLRKAVEALEYYAVESMPWDADDSLIARTTLAEIKSGVATTPYGLEGENHE